MPRDQAPNPLRWWILSAVGVGSVMMPLDASVVNIALPSITASFDTVLPVSEWVAMSYLLVISSLLLTYGRAGDLYGHRRMYLAGFGIFTVGSLLCSLAPSIGALIGFRVVQALGAGMMMAAGPAIIVDTFPIEERGRALGLNGTMVGIGLAAGPVFGGLLVTLLGWRSIFYINLPIGLAGIWWGHRILPHPKPFQGIRRFDVAGAVTLFASLFSLLLALSRGEEWGWSSPAIVTLWVAGVASSIVFVAVEVRAPSPMMDLSLFRIRLFSAANVSSLLSFVAQYSVVFLTPFYLQLALGLPPDRAGLILLWLPSMMLFAAPLAGILSDRLRGSTLLSSAGMAVVVGGLLAMSRLTVESTGWDISWRLALVGLGSGVFTTPNNAAIMGSVPRERLGLASGMLASMRNIGMVLGVAVSGAVFTARHADYLERAARGLLSPEAAYANAVRDAFMAGATIALVAVFTSLVRGRGIRGATGGFAGVGGDPETGG